MIEPKEIAIWIDMPWHVLNELARNVSGKFLAGVFANPANTPNTEKEMLDEEILKWIKEVAKGMIPNWLHEYMIFTEDKLSTTGLPRYKVSLYLIHPKDLCG